jgi:heterodisulfide reductase subunit B
MDYAYYPGCSLTGSARALDKGVRRVAALLGHRLTEIPDWNCCGAMEYGDRRELLALSGENLEKSKHLGRAGVVAPCPACYKNLKEADAGRTYNVLSPLELIDGDALSRIPARRDLRGRVFTPYYGCILLRPEGTAIRNKNVMEEAIAFFGGEIEGEKVKDKCCGGGRFFAGKWATEKLSTLILEKSAGTLVVFCPLCHMALTTFTKESKVVYLTDLLLYVMGEGGKL